MDNYVVELRNNHSDSVHCIQDGAGFPYRYTSKCKAEEAGEKHIGDHWKKYKVIKVN